MRQTSRDRTLSATQLESVRRAAIQYLLKPHIARFRGNTLDLQGLSFEDAQNLASEVVAILLEKDQRGDIRPGGSIGGLAKAICIGLVLNHNRKASTSREQLARDPSAPESDQRENLVEAIEGRYLPPHAEDVEQRPNHEVEAGASIEIERTRAEISERRNLLKLAMEHLASEEREILSAYYFDEIPNAAIARRLGVTAGATTKRRQRAETKLSRLIEALTIAPGLPAADLRTYLSEVVR